MKLARRIIAVAFLTVLAMMGAASYFTIRTTYDAFEAQQHAVATSVERALVEPLREAWAADGSQGVDRLLRKENQANHAGLRLRWVWYDDNAPASSRPHLPAERWPSPGDVQPVSLITVDDAGRRLLHTYIEVDLAANRRGGLELTEALEPLDRLTWRRMQIDLAALGALAIASAGVAYWTGVVWVSHPLQALMAKTQRIAQGDFTEPLALTRRDEFRELAVAVNEMSARLAEQRAALEAETDRRLAALEQLRHVERLTTVGRLAAGIAHELGTPLNVIAGRAALIASGRLAAEESRSSALAIKGEADRITKIIRHLLDFARQRRLHRARTNLHDLAAQTADLVRQLAKEKNVQIEVARGCGNVTASVDPSQIRQVLMNLLTNAIDSLPQGGKVRVEVSGDAGEAADNRQEPSLVRLAVIDQGTGIPESDLKHIFEPFFTTKDVGRGTGLGLSIAYGIVQEHGGRIEVASQVGQGSRFTVYLPLENVA